MTLRTCCLIIFITGLSFFLSLPGMAADQNKGITEYECARLQNAEIIWDLSEYRWMCCIIKNEDEYETCQPITDMKPLPKKSLKPLPRNNTKTIKPEKQ